MKTMIITLAAATALTAGAAAAQPYGWGRDDGMSIDARQERIAFRIDQGVRSGQLTGSEAYRLRTEFNRIARLEFRYRINGLSNWERDDLDRRLDMLTSEVRMARRDDDRRYGYLEREYYPPY